MRTMARIAPLSVCLLGFAIFATLSHASIVGLIVNVAIVGSAALAGAMRLRRLVPDESSVVRQLALGAIMILTLSRMLLIGIAWFTRFEIASLGVIALVVALAA